MKKVYFLSTCSTCKKIFDQLDLSDFEFTDIKDQPLELNQLDELKEIAGSFESLFSKRSQLYKQRGMKDMNLTEQDYKKFLLEHYTFLQRPVIVDGQEIYIGSSPKNKNRLLKKFGK